jgi:hypothetical protein
MAKHIIPLPSQEELHELFEYRDGRLYWKNCKLKTYNGKEAGWLETHGRRNGYRRIEINAVAYSVHRIIFKMFTNIEPPEVDHIKRKLPEFDNSIENLRAATRLENTKNCRKPKTNTSGCKNVSWKKQNKKWCVALHVAGKTKHIGYFKDLELADLVAQEARDKYHKEFANHG